MCWRQEGIGVGRGPGDWDHCCLECVITLLDPCCLPSCPILSPPPRLSEARGGGARWRFGICRGRTCAPSGTAARRFRSLLRLARHFGDAREVNELFLQHGGVSELLLHPRLRARHCHRTSRCRSNCSKVSMTLQQSSKQAHQEVRWMELSEVIVCNAAMRQQPCVDLEGITVAPGLCAWIPLSQGLL